MRLFRAAKASPHAKFYNLSVADDVIACDLWFGPPPIKNPGYAYG